MRDLEKSCGLTTLLEKVSTDNMRDWEVNDGSYATKPHHLGMRKAKRKLIEDRMKLEKTAFANSGPEPMFKDAVKSNDVSHARNLLTYYMISDPTDRKGEIGSALAFAEQNGMTGLFQPHDGSPLQGAADWSEEYFTSNQAHLINNFSKERFEHAAEVGKEVYKNSAVPEMPSPRMGTGLISSPKFKKGALIGGGAGAIFAGGVGAKMMYDKHKNEKRAFVENRMQLEKLAFTLSELEMFKQQQQAAANVFRADVKPPDVTESSNFMQERLKGIKEPRGAANEIIVSNQQPEAPKAAPKKSGKGKAGLIAGGVAAGGVGAKMLYDQMERQKTAFIEDRMMMEKMAKKKKGKYESELTDEFSQLAKQQEEAVKAFKQNSQKLDQLNPKSPSVNDYGERRNPAPNKAVNAQSTSSEPVKKVMVDRGPYLPATTNQLPDAPKKTGKGKLGLIAGGVAAGGIGAKMIHDKMKQEKTAFVESRMRMEKLAGLSNG